MKLAVLSDIHGNIFALKKCFEYIDHNNFDGIVWCGDFISDVPHSREVLDFIQLKNNEYKHWLVKGNREDYFINYHFNNQGEWSLDNNNAPLLLAYKQLTQSDLDYIKRMPSSTVVNIDGCPEIYVTHKFKEVPYLQKDFKYKYVIFGHQHNQLLFSKNNIRFFNPGSTGLPADGIKGTSLMIIEFIDNHWQPNFIHLQYDINLPINSIKNSELNNITIKWGEVLTKALLTGSDYTGIYIRGVKKRANELGLSERLEDIKPEIWNEVRERLNKEVL